MKRKKLLWIGTNSKALYKKKTLSIDDTHNLDLYVRESTQPNFGYPLIAFSPKVQVNTWGKISNEILRDAWRGTSNFSNMIDEGDYIDMK